METTTGGGELLVVASDARMDDEVFAKHMSLRHTESLGGLPVLIPLPAVIPAWRAFHRRLHALAVGDDIGHEHAATLR